MEIKNRQIQQLINALDNLYGSPGHVIKRGFLLGLASGVGTIIGIALAIIVLGFLVSKLGGIPLIGDILQRINEAVPH